MEWFWALLGMVWTYLMGGAALWSWKAPNRWAERGSVSNGLGTTIVFSDNPAAFRLLNFVMKTFAVWLSAMAIGGAVVSVGWIWRAL